MRDEVIQLLREEASWSGDFIILPADDAPAAPVFNVPEPLKVAEEAPAYVEPVVQRPPEPEPLKPAEALLKIQSELGDCQRCGAGPQTIVFGEGDPSAPVMFIGPFPGAAEEQTGQPFMDEAGQLLTRIIEGGMRLSRRDVYITYLLKCRQGDPSRCMAFLQREIMAVKPRVIVTLGDLASQSLLDSREPIARLRGRFHDFMGIRVMPTFHPADLLTNQNKKRDVWEDIKKVLAELDH